MRMLNILGLRRAPPRLLMIFFQKQFLRTPNFDPIMRITIYEIWVYELERKNHTKAAQKLRLLFFYVVGICCGCCGEIYGV